MINKKIFSWGLYDFANSLLIANGTLYLSQWVVVENKIPDIFYGLIFTLSSVLLIFTNPVFGLWSDRIGKRILFLRILSILVTTLGISITFLGIFIPVVFWKVFLVLAFWFFLNYSYQLSLVFYNALLPRLTTREKFGRISGVGEFFGNLGWIVGSVITLPVVYGMITFFEGSQRIQTVLPASILFFLLALPMLLLIKDKPTGKQEFKLRPSLFFTQTFKGFMASKKYPGMRRFLIAFYFYSDAILTVGLFFPIYFQEVLGLSDAGKVVVLTIILVGMVLGNFPFGFIGDRFGHKQGLTWAILGCVAIFPILATFSEVTLPAYILALILGVFYGGVFVLSRSLLATLAPPGKMGEFFGYLAMSERFASIIGPLLWGGTVLIFGFLGVSKYRVALISMVILLLLGAYILRKVPNKRISTLYTLKVDTP